MSQDLGSWQQGSVDGEPWRDPAPSLGSHLGAGVGGVCTCVSWCFLFAQHKVIGQSSLAQEKEANQLTEAERRLVQAVGVHRTPWSGEREERAERPPLASHPSLSTHWVLCWLTAPTPVPLHPGGHVVSGFPRGRGLSFPGLHDSDPPEGPSGNGSFTCMVFL